MKFKLSQRNVKRPDGRKYGGPRGLVVASFLSLL